MTSMSDATKRLMAGGVSVTIVTLGMGAALSLTSDITVTAEAYEGDDTAGQGISTTPRALSQATTELPASVTDASQGTFSFDQTTITPNEVIASTFRSASSTLCQATDDFVQVNPLEWRITLSGEVDAAFTADVGDLSNEDSVRQTMTCTCGGNPADGRAIITADIKGIPVSYLLDRAQARANVNTLTFVASDGTEVSMPLAYVVAHHGIISYQINGEDLSASVGGNNQLWLAGTSANYFVRDIVEIRVSAENEVPANPGDGMSYPNSPNVGLLSADVK